MEKFVSIEKMSKKARRALYQQRRGSWGVINPCTRKPGNPKAYRRKKGPAGRAFLRRRIFFFFRLSRSFILPCMKINGLDMNKLQSITWVIHILMV